MSKKIVILLITLIPIALGSWLLYFAYELHAVQKEMLTWPSVNATVTDHNIHYNGPTKNTKPSYNCVLTYSYSLNNKNYNSTTLSTPYGEDQNFYDNKIDALRDCETHPIKSNLTVYYNPQILFQTVTKKRIDNGDSILSALVGMFLVLLGAGAGFVTYNKLKE